MARNSFIPRRDTDLLRWARSASGFITLHPTDYGLTPGIATSFNANIDAFDAALTAVAPDVRSKVAVSTKEAQKTVLINGIRAWAKIVDGTATVSDAQRLELGLNVRSAASQVPAPSDKPHMDIAGVEGRSIRVKLHNGTGSPRARAANVKGATVLSYVGAAAPLTPSQWSLQGTTNKLFLTVDFPPTLAPGTTVWLTAYWVGTRLESGPPCDPVSVTFGAPGAAVAA